MKYENFDAASKLVKEIREREVNLVRLAACTWLELSCAGSRLSYDVDLDDAYKPGEKEYGEYTKTFIDRLKSHEENRIDNLKITLAAL